MTLAAGGSGTAQGPLVFVGYGITAPDWKYDDYAGIDVQGKIVVMLRKEPQQGDATSLFNGLQAVDACVVSPEDQECAGTWGRRGDHGQRCSTSSIGASTAAEGVAAAVDKLTAAVDEFKQLTSLVR